MKSNDFFTDDCHVVTPIEYFFLYSFNCSFSSYCIRLNRKMMRVLLLFLSLAPEFPVSMAIKKRNFSFISFFFFQIFFHLITPNRIYIFTRCSSRSFFMIFFLYPIAKETEMKLDTHSWWWWGLMKWFHSTFYFHS